MEQDTEQTKVIFRVWKKGGGVIAIFPQVPCDYAGYMVMSYERVGQHGGADYISILQRTRLARENEYAALYEELQGIGYNLRVVKREQYADVLKRIQSAA